MNLFFFLISYLTHFIFFIYFLHLDNDLDYVTGLEVCKNICQLLQKICYTERYSGFKRAIIAAAMHSKISIKALSALLQVC